MSRARRTATPKEILRLTPGQFSAAVAGVVLVAALSMTVGYYIGRKASPGKGEGNSGITEAGKIPQIVEGNNPSDTPSRESTAPTITFYSALTKTEPLSKTRPSIKESTPKPSIAAKRAPSPEILSGRGEGLVIQIASYRQKEKARDLLKAMNDSGYAGTVVRADLGPRGVWYRVRLGPFRSLSAAKKVLATLRDEKNLKGFVVRQ